MTCGERSDLCAPCENCGLCSERLNVRCVEASETLTCQNRPPNLRVFVSESMPCSRRLAGRAACSRASTMRLFLLLFYFTTSLLPQQPPPPEPEPPEPSPPPPPPPYPPLPDDCAMDYSQIAAGNSCGSRVNWVMNNHGSTRPAAEAQVASEYPDVCNCRPYPAPPPHPRRNARLTRRSRTRSSAERRIRSRHSVGLFERADGRELLHAVRKHRWLRRLHAVGQHLLAKRRHVNDVQQRRADRLHCRRPHLLHRHQHRHWASKAKHRPVRRARAAHHRPARRWRSSHRRPSSTIRRYSFLFLCRCKKAATTSTPCSPIML